MKIDYAKIDEVNGEITVTLEEKDYADKVKKQLKEIGKKHAELGFSSRSRSLRTYTEKIWRSRKI